MKKHLSENDRSDQLEWLLKKRLPSKGQEDDSYEPYYGDVTELNTNRLIMDSVGVKTLRQIAEDAIDLLETSVAIYESNGDYAFGMFSSGWCQLMDTASRKHCHTDDNRIALDCGCWLCHDNCWNDSAKAAIESGQSTDIQCVGGINLYAEPIYAGKSVVGTINIGYGTPPKDPDRLKELAEIFDVDLKKLKDQAYSYDPRPQFLVDLAQKHLKTSARIIGEIVEKSMIQRALQESERRLRISTESGGIGLWELDLINLTAWRSLTHDQIFGYKKLLSEWTYEVFLDHVVKEDRPMVEEKFGKALKNKKFWDFQCRIKRIDGVIRQIHAKGKPELDKNQNAIKMYGTVQDITDLKLVQREAMVLKTAIDQAPVGIALADENIQIYYCNPEGLGMRGGNIGDLVEIPKDAFDNWQVYQTNGEAYEIDNLPLVRAIKKGETIREEFIVKNQDGTDHTCDAFACPVFENGKIIGGMVVFLDITERKQAGEAREQLLARLQTTLEATADGILVVDNNGKQVLSSSRYAKMWRIPDEVLETKDDDQVLAFFLDQLKDPDRFLDKVRHLYATPEKNSFDTIEFKDGRIFERYSRPHKLNDQIIGRVWSFRDVTKQKFAESQLEQSKKRYQELVENLNDVIFSVDAAGIITYVSPQIESVIGYTSDELIKTSFVDLIHPDDLDSIFSAFKDILTGNLHPSEYRIKSKNGNYRWVRTSSRPAQENGQVVGLHGVLTDIMDRKQAERVILDSESKFRNLFEMSPQAIALTDIDSGKLIDINDKFCELTQYSKEELIGRTTVEVDFYSSEDRKFFIDELQSSGAVDGLEMNFKAKDGSLLTALMFARIVEILQRPIILTVFNDITAQKHLQDQLRQAHKMEAIGTLAGGIAHEFNNMLGIIIGNTELALDDIPEWNPAADCIQEIRTASLRAKDVVRKLLSVARKTPESRKPVQIRTIVDESIKLLRKTIPASIDIRSNFSCTTETIFADPTEISQVLMNLCTNSAHAMVDRKGVLEVTLETRMLDARSAVPFKDIAPGDYVKLAVSDDGTGIPPEILDRIFEPYFTTKDVDEGLGMGLAVVHGIVKKHEGAIRVESEVGKGTTVEVLFPLVDEQPIPAAKEIETLSTGTELILFVDDEASLVKMMTQMLTRSDYKVVGKTSSAEALKAFKANPERFDLVITDMAMPEMTGAELANQILQARPDIPIILCTGHSDRMDENRAMELGIKAFVMKPLTKSDLTKTVRKVLDETKS